MHRFVAVGIILLAGILPSANADEVDEILKLPTRPTLAMISALPPQTFIYKPIEDDEERAFHAYKHFIIHLLNEVPDKKFFLLARDTEDFYEAFQTVLSNHPNGKALSSRVILLPVSRAVAESSDQRALIQWLNHNGLDTKAVIEGREKTSIVDIGYNGQIFKNLLATLIREIPAEDPLRYEKLENILENVEGRLMASYNPPKMSKLISSVKQKPPFSEVIDWIQHSSFGLLEILPEQKRAAAGLPANTEARVSWIANNVRNPRPNWEGRGLKLNREGTAIHIFDSPSSPDARINRKAVLRRQALILKHFSTPEMTREMEKPISDSFAHYRLKNFHLNTSRLEDVELKPGVRFKTPGGKEFKVLDLVHRGSKANIFQIEAEGKLFALKIPIDHSAESEAALQEDISRIKTLERLGFSHARMIESGNRFLLKEWIVGIDGKEWLSQWESEGGIGTSAPAVALKSIVELSILKKAYIRNLRPSNLIWDGTRWVVVDSGPAKESLTSDEVRNRYSENFSERWAERLGPTCSQTFKQIFLPGTP